MITIQDTGHCNECQNEVTMIDFGNCIIVFEDDENRDGTQVCLQCIEKALEKAASEITLA